MNEPKFKVGDKVWYVYAGEFIDGKVIEVFNFISADRKEYFEYMIGPDPKYITYPCLSEDKLYKSHTYEEMYNSFWVDKKIYDFNDIDNINSFPALEKIAFKIFYDLTDRRGIKQSIESCDDDAIEEIFQKFLKIAKEEINKL